jgi:guanine nucleotide-binding protein subunit alpha
MDILEANLDAGISVQKYVPSYGDAPNDMEHVTKCMPGLCGTSTSR